MQEELEQRTVSVSIQAAKLSGRVLRAAIAAVLQKMEQERTMPKVGRNSMKRLTYKDPGANTIEVSGRIRSFERYARKHQVRYHIEKELGTDGKESGGLQLHGRGTGIDTHEPKYELICSIRFEESTVYGAKHRTY